jgi:glycosidase
MCLFNDENVNKEYQLLCDYNGEGYDNFVVNIELPEGLYFYYFKMDGVPYERYIGIDGDFNACLMYENVRPWQLSVYKQCYETPKWLNSGIMYQIYVDRFNPVGDVIPTEDKIMRKWGEQPYYQEADGSVKNRDFFGGTLKGVTEKLDYLKSLNVKTIYLNPIFTAYSNHKYDTEDYETIDSMLGTREDFDELLKKSAALGMSVILDGVFNHVGSSSKYFNKDKKYGSGGAFWDKKSPYRSWFNFDKKGGYECWWNFDTLPRINGESLGAQDYFTGKDGIVPRYIEVGVKGWRLDVVDEVPDAMLDKIVSSAKAADSQSVIIGEVWEDASNKIDYGVRRRFFGGRQLDSVMNYPLRNAIIAFIKDGNEYALKAATFNIVNNYPLHVRNNLMNVLGTHDTARILTTLAGDTVDNSAKERMSRMRLNENQYVFGINLLKLATILQYTMFGFPSVFYGDEVGLEGYRDPFCRVCYPYGRENKLLLDFYRHMGRLRDLAVFRDGTFNTIVAKHCVFAFERTSPDHAQKAVVCVNRADVNFNLILDGTYIDQLTGRTYTNHADVVPFEAVVLLKAD